MHQIAGVHLNRANADSLTWLAAVAVAGLAFALTFGGSVFSASVSDTSGYVSAAKGLMDDELVRPAPLQLIPSITGMYVPTSPLAYVPGPAAGTEVPVYPLGLPYLMAATETVLGPRAAFAVTPLSLAMLALLAFVLARDAAGNAAGIGAAVLVVADPAALLNAVWGMSDVPAAACWIAAWYFALRDTRSSAITAGCLCALGSTIRPILGPLAVVIGCQCLLSNAPVGVPSRWNWGRCGAFLCVAIAGPLLVAWSQSALYGNPFRSGYPAGIAMFGLAYVGQNLRNYPHLFIDVHGPGLAATLAAGLAFVLSPSPIGRLVRTGIPLAVLNFALYAIYLPYDSWPFLRFLLPATTVIFVIASAGLAGLIWPLPVECQVGPAALGGHRSASLDDRQRAGELPIRCRGATHSRQDARDGRLPRRRATPERRRAVVHSQRRSGSLHRPHDLEAGAHSGAAARSVGLDAYEQRMASRICPR